MGWCKFLIVMEPQFQSFTLVSTFLLFLFALFKFLKRAEPETPTLKKPPGPWKLPLIGNMHQLIRSQPHHSLTLLAKKYGPLMHLQLGEVSSVIISSPEMAREALKTHDVNFSYRSIVLAIKILSYGCKDIAFAPYANYWRQLRKICTMELLSLSRVQSFRWIREEEVLNLIKSLSSHEGSPINLTVKIFSLIYGITARAAFGKKSKDQEKFIAIMPETSKLISGFALADYFPSIKALQFITGIGPKVEKLQRETDMILQKILNEHKERKKLTTKVGQAEAGEDLVDILLKIQQDSDLEFPITDNNIKGVIWDVFSGGSESSSATITWAMTEMMKNPRVMKEAQPEVRRVFKRKGNVDERDVHELKYLHLVVKETLRLHPPAPLLVPRESKETCEINGYKIPEKTRVIINAWAIARDPRYWSDPEKFYPERFLNNSVDFRGTDFEFLPFGGGRRMCPGITFALANLHLPLAQLLYHFDWKLPDGMKTEDLDMTEAMGMSIRRKEDLILIPVAYNPMSVE